MNRLLWISIGLAVLCFAPGQVRAQSDFRLLQRPPVDSANARDMRIWIPVERTINCRMAIDLRDDSNRVVRHLVDHMFKKGYYNFYWDKKDDSGRFVPEGRYLYTIKDCGLNRTRELIVKYRRRERDCTIYPQESERSNKVRFRLEGDTARVTLSILSQTGRKMFVPVRDSLFHAGDHEYVFTRSERYSAGKYKVQLRVSGHIHEATIYHIR